MVSERHVSSAVVDRRPPPSTGAELVEVGAQLQVVGRCEETAQFGRRYRMLATESASPSTVSEIRALLGSGMIGELGLFRRARTRLIV